ncbi:MAG: hypothetical protein HPM95_00465 [Alphaproteobacteria bacterium]|nr:hypothetical protein [Alphaproteobacteria bacterium]
MSERESQYALLLGNYRPTMVIARELRARGFRVATGLDGFERGAALSRHVDRLWTHPKLEEDEAAFAHALSKVLARRDDIRLVVPVSEPYVRFFARGEVVLPRGVTAMMVAPQLVEACLDKRRMMATAEAAGVPVAPFAEVCDYAELIGETERIGFPVVIRSLSSSHRLLGEKAVTVEDRAALERLLPDWPEGHPALLVQRRASGPRQNLYFSARDGRIDSLLHVEITRTDRLDGAGLAVEGGRGDRPDLGRYTAAMIEALDYSGIGCAQFLVDPETGATCFLEINPRFAGNHAIPAACGLDLTDRLLDVCFARSATRAGAAADTHAASLLLARGRPAWRQVARRQGQVSNGEACRWLRRTIRARWRAQLDVGFDWRDPLPGLLAILDVLPGIGKLVRMWKIHPGWFAKDSL